MKIKKPFFWSSKNLISIIFLPLSLIVILITSFKRKFIKKINFNIPIICVGNIYLGGTGKTPLALLLARELTNFKVKPVIIRKHYKQHEDEILMIKNQFNDLITDNNRIKALKIAEKNASDLVILDDGFQDIKIKKDLNIICFNQKQLVGNGYVLPAGPLRESLNSLSDANILIINGKKEEKFEKKVLRINKELDIFYSKYVPQNLKDFENKQLIALAGIGNPNNFFDLLSQYNLKVVKKLIFPDHYQFDQKQILSIADEASKNNLQIIMTEKDYFKVKKYSFSDKFQFLKVNLEIENKDKLIKKILSTYENF